MGETLTLPIRRLRRKLWDIEDKGHAYMPDINAEWEVSVQDVKRGLADRSIVLVDVREADEHRLCRIDGAVLVPLSEIEQRVEEVRAAAGGKPVVCHCHHGGRSLRATAFLRSAGMADVKSMAGGIDEWAEHIDPKVPRY